MKCLGTETWEGTYAAILPGVYVVLQRCILTPPLLPEETPIILMLASICASELTLPPLLAKEEVCLSELQGSRARLSGANPKQPQERSKFSAQMFCCPQRFPTPPNRRIMRLTHLCFCSPLTKPHQTHTHPLNKSAKFSFSLLGSTQIKKALESERTDRLTTKKGVSEMN